MWVGLSTLCTKCGNECVVSMGRVRPRSPVPLHVSVQPSTVSLRVEYSALCMVKLDYRQMARMT